MNVRSIVVEQLSDRQWMILLFFLAVLVRLVGVDYGYFHGDERINDAAKVLTGDLVPGEHFYPPLLNYINAVFIAALFVVGRILGFWHDTEGFQAQYFNNPLVFYITCRFVIICIAAAIAPLFYQFSRRLEFSKLSSILVALLAVFLPAAVFLSHFSKSDLALASTTIWVFYLVFCKLENVASKKLDFLLGLGVALAFSFKQTYLFIAAPLFFGYLILLSRRTTVVPILFSVLNSALVFLPLMIVFNIGSILDYERYIEFQKIQQVMSFRDDTFIDALGAFFRWTADSSAGITALPLVLFLAFPFFVFKLFPQQNHREFLWLMWGSIFVGTVIVIVITGERQHSGLLIAYWTGIQLCAALAIATLSNIKRVGRYLQIGIASISVGYLTVGTLEVWKQAASKPVVESLAEYLSSNYANRKIMTSAEIRAPQHNKAKQDDYARHLRIAEKYKVTMPERAEERARLDAPEDALFYRTMPGVMHGLENANDEDLEGIVQPYAWPLQKEEWSLDYWRKLGFSVFVVSNLETMSSDKQSQLVRDYYASMQSDCELKDVFYASKPDFLEHDIHVFECPLT
jgi:hypothetical protein